LEIVVVIPALNEEDTIVDVIQELQRQGLFKIWVVDNGSCDRTSVLAAQAGAQILLEPRRGYGQACWSGLQIPEARQAEWILFCDADGSDDLSQLPQLLALQADCDLILGNRRGTLSGRSQLTPVQNFGNWLATRLIQWGWGYAYDDLGPLRLIRRQALDQMAMGDRGYGWTVEMQVKAVEQQLRICERPVNYLPRQGGRSKIAGTITGSVKAGKVILSTLAVLYWQKTVQKLALPTNAHLGHPFSSRYSTCRLPMQSGLRWAIAILLMLGSLMAAPHGDFLNQPSAVPLFWRGMGLMNLGFIAAWGLQKVGGNWFWLLALGPRLVLLSLHPGDDIWRYLWEGHIQTLGFNPYVLPPSAEVLLPFRFDWWSHINHPDLVTIYPPVTELGFRFLAAMSPTVGLFKLVFVATDLGICGLLSRRFGYRAAVLYAWNPLVMYSFAGGGHYDSWFLLPLVAAWLWWDNYSAESAKRPLLVQLGSVLLVGLSIATKWMSLPVLVFLGARGQFQWRQQNRRLLSIGYAIALLLLGLVPIALATLPFCTELSCPIMPLNSPFVHYGRSAAFIPEPITNLWPAAPQTNWPQTNWIYALPLAAVLLWSFIQSANVGQFIERYLIALMLLSPVIHVWYFTWLVPFAVASGNWGTRLVSVSAFIYFALPHSVALGNDQWMLSAQQHWGLWGPFLLGLVISVAIPKVGWKAGLSKRES
jgi:hypothetical protein